MADNGKAAKSRSRLAGMDRNTAIVAGIGAAAAVAVGALFWGGGEDVLCVEQRDLGGATAERRGSSSRDGWAAAKVD